MWLLAAGFAAMMSLPFLVPGTSLLALTGLVPLLWMDKIASEHHQKKVWIWHFSAFVLWNAITTFWVWNATAGGAVFAILYNSFQMSLLFGLFRLSKKHYTGTVPYIFLAVLWIGWERFYLNTQMSWPWLTLGNAFAKDVSLVQWYEYTGSLGGSLWIWACNLTIFGFLSVLSSGKWKTWNNRAKAYGITLAVLLFMGPILFSEYRYHTYEETTEPLDVAIFQPNIDPYNKFEALNQSQQNAILIRQMKENLADRLTDSAARQRALLAVAPETFTNDVSTNHIEGGYTFNQFKQFLSDYPNVNLVFGASSYEYIPGSAAPSHTARKINDHLWYESHNSALIMDATGRNEIFHKSKLVVGAELTPYPAFFAKIDNLLGGVMGRCVGQKEISNLHCIEYGPGGQIRKNIPIGSAICYESVYGEYCTGYIKKGAQALVVITNDAWWGDTPGYRQHLSYSSLRAIETRRDIARSANTGISAIINQKGQITARTGWWQPACLRGTLHLNDQLTFFVKNGDIIGKFCLFITLLLSMGLISKIIMNKKK